MNLAAIIGYIATLLSTISFLPQVFQAWKTKQTKDISLQSYVILSFSTFMWLTYGLLIHQMPVIIANGIVFISAVSIVFLKFKHG